MLSKKAWYRIALPALLIMAIFISGCNQKETVKPGATETGNTTPQTRTISTMMGDVTVPLNPERVVVDWNIGHVLAVGVTPLVCRRPAGLWNVPA